MKIAAIFISIIFLMTAFVGPQVWADEQNPQSPQGGTITQPVPKTEPEAGAQEKSSPMKEEKAQPAAMLKGSFAVNDIRGKKVENTEGEVLGKIDNVIVGSNGEARYLILSHGGFLGIGATLTPIPWEAVGDEVRQSMGKGQFVVASLSKDQLDKAPTLAEEKDFENPQWNEKVHAFYPQTGAGAMKSEEAGKTGERAGAQQPEEGETMAMRKGETAGAMAGGHYQGVNDYLGRGVQNPAGEILGRVEDVIFNDKWEATYVLLSHGGSLGGSLGASIRLVPIPWSAVTFDKQKDALIVNIDRKRLSEAPSVERGKYQDFDNPQWSEKVHGYYEQQAAPSAEKSKGMTEEREKGMEKPERGMQPDKGTENKGMEKKY